MLFQSFDRDSLRRGLLGLAGLSSLFLTSCGGGGAESPDVVATTPAGAAADSAGNLIQPGPSSELVDIVEVERPEGLPADDPILGPVLVIDGEVISHDQIRRQVVLGPAGAVPIEMAKLRVFLEQEIDRQKAAGVSAERFAVTTDEVSATIEGAKEAIQAEYEETLDFEELGMEELDAMSQARLEVLFRKVFMPENPADYPLTSLDALNSSEDGKSILDHLQQTYDRNQAEDQAGNRDPLQERMINSIVMEKLVEFLNGTATIESGEAVPANVIMRVNGEDITVDEVWKEIEGRITPVEVRLAKLWLINMTLIQNALEAEGDWLTAEEAAASYLEYSAPYQDSLFSIERLALAIKKFPNIGAYQEYRRAYDSYARMIADELNPENLRSFGEERTKKLIGQSHVDVDVILLSAFDFKKRSWQPGGWEEAGQRANEVLRLLVEEGRPWDEVMDDFSDFYDPPTPKSQAGLPDKSLNKGRFRGRARNQLMSLLEESEYWQFLHGTSITDFIFFEQGVGETSAPLRGPYGWYIPRLLNRSKDIQQLIQDQDAYMTMVEQDYVMTNLGRFTQELVAKSDIYGLE